LAFPENTQVDLKTIVVSVSDIVGLAKGRMCKSVDPRADAYECSKTTGLERADG
jgi:hypothetical protein